MKTKTNTNKNQFCYNMRRWPVNKEAKPLLKEIVLDAIDAARNDLENEMGIDGTYLSEDSIINDFSDKKKIALLNNLENAVKGKPFFGISSSTDLILEELLYNVVSSHVIITFDMEKGLDKYFKKYCDKIRKVYSLHHDDNKIPDNQTIIDWFSDELWWDMDWEIFQIDTKKYARKYINVS